MVRPEGLEPPTLGSEVRCSIQLSYGRTPRYFKHFAGEPVKKSTARIRLGSLSQARLNRLHNLRHCLPIGIDRMIGGSLILGDSLGQHLLDFLNERLGAGQ